MLTAHKAGGMFSKDDVVTPVGGGQGPCYYLEFPWTWTSRWDMTLQRGPHKGGPPIARLLKGGYGFSQNDIEITLLESGFRTVLAKRSFWSRSHEFEGIYGGRFKWQMAGILTSSMEVGPPSSLAPFRWRPGRVGGHARPLQER